ncbi:MAG TPA: O-antigen ligase family protein [Candidatus Kapabacteria bacterium]|nr:O-antigen ligase family protein [Candidatus Kapabacteria bacterium]
MRNFQLVCSTPPHLVVSDHEHPIFSFRTIKYILLWLLLWQDNMVLGSPIQIIERLVDTGAVHPLEVWLIICFLTLCLERIISGNYELRRSYFWGPLLLMALALVFSYIRGMLQLQEFRIVFEIHEAILLPVAYFVILNMFREPGEWRVLLVLLIFASIGKAFDGALIYFFSNYEKVQWGVLQLWRDGFLMAIGVLSTLLLFHYKGRSLMWLKRLLYWTTPVMLFTLIVSYRRTFFLAILVGCAAMIFLLPRERRAKQLLVIFGFIFAILIVVLATDPVGFFMRFFGAFNPDEEGSAYIRMMEYPNIFLNIYHNPIWGVPIGTFWHQYYRMPMYAVYTLYGCHNTYLYWQLRCGIPGTVAFWWFISRQWKAALIQFRLTRNTEEKNFFAILSILIMVVYHVACMLGLLYADGFIIMAVYMVALQLMMESELGLKSLRDVRLIPTLKHRRLVYWGEEASAQAVQTVSAS